MRTREDFTVYSIGLRFDEGADRGLDVKEVKTFGLRTVLFQVH